jgi:hypothetical protein
VKIIRKGGTVTVTMTATEAVELREELLWVKNVDEGGPAMRLWQKLVDLDDDGADPEAVQATNRKDQTR